MSVEQIECELADNAFRMGADPAATAKVEELRQKLEARGYAARSCR